MALKFLQRGNIASSEAILIGLHCKNKTILHAACVFVGRSSRVSLLCYILLCRRFTILIRFGTRESSTQTYAPSYPVSTFSAVSYFLWFLRRRISKTALLFFLGRQPSSSFRCLTSQLCCNKRRVERQRPI